MFIGAFPLPLFDGDLRDDVLSGDTDKGILK
jgi:hypothetical protein